MSRKTLNFREVEINKSKFHDSKQPNDLNLVDVHKIVTPCKLNMVIKALKE